MGVLKCFRFGASLESSKLALSGGMLRSTDSSDFFQYE